MASKSTAVCYVVGPSDELYGKPSLRGCDLKQPKYCAAAWRLCWTSLGKTAQQYRRLYSVFTGGVQSTVLKSSTRGPPAFRNGLPRKGGCTSLMCLTGIDRHPQRWIETRTHSHSAVRYAGCNVGSSLVRLKYPDVSRHGNYSNSA